jgi:hypothetical protein
MAMASMGERALLMPHLDQALSWSAELIQIARSRMSIVNPALTAGLYAHALNALMAPALMFPQCAWATIRVGRTSAAALACSADLATVVALTEFALSPGVPCRMVLL